MIHQQIKDQIKDAMRAKDTVRLDTLRSLNSAIQNELLTAAGGGDSLADDKVLTIIRRSVKQHKDSIDQFQKGGRADLVAKEQAELDILNAFLPAMMSEADVKTLVSKRVAELKAQPGFDPKSSGKIVGTMMKELAGKADGTLVKKAVEDALK